jgi:hypothetical protein
MAWISAFVLRDDAGQQSPVDCRHEIEASTAYRGTARQFGHPSANPALVTMLGMPSNSEICQCFRHYQADSQGKASSDRAIPISRRYTGWTGLSTVAMNPVPKAGMK